MNDVTLQLNNAGRGAFVIDVSNERLGEMEIGINGTNLVVYHTQVSDKLKGQGAGGKLLEAMVTHARQHNLKVIPLCPYVLAQFKRHAEQYADLWNQHWHDTKS